MLHLKLETIRHFRLAGRLAFRGLTLAISRARYVSAFLTANGKKGRSSLRPESPWCRFEGPDA
jgi:hypothetical protein